MKKTRIILAMAMAVAMLSMTACGSDSAAEKTTVAVTTEAATEAAAEEKAEAATEAASETKAADETKAAETVSGEYDGKLHGPYLMTTCGQSTGSVMLHMVAVQKGLTSTDEHTLTAADIKADEAATLIITTGTSGKGMGAAGTDIDAEIARCTELAEAAKSAGMTVVCAHVEGMSRRTDSADQASIDNIIGLADVIICVDDSDSDGLFSDYAAANNVPIIKTADALSLGEYME